MHGSHWSAGASILGILVAWALPVWPTSFAQVQASAPSLDSELELTVLPFGVDAFNESVRSYWAAEPTVPATRITLRVAVMVGLRLSQLLQAAAAPALNLAIHMERLEDSALIFSATQPLEAAYELNIGSVGPIRLNCELLCGDEIVARGALSVRIGAIAMPRTAAPDLYGALPRDPESTSPPWAMPADAVADFTMGLRSKVYHHYFDDFTDRATKSYPIYSKDAIDALVARAEKREENYYGKTDSFLYAALRAHPIRGLRVLIIGSNVPWYESICIAHQAALCVTLEYNQLRYQHPETHTYTVTEWEAAQASGAACEWPSVPFRCKFDAVWSISSFEHDGLGRYGDPIRPDGDLVAMASLAQYVELGRGTVFLSVPVGEDAVYWNEGRVYGGVRLPLLLRGWRVLSAHGMPVDAVASSDRLLDAMYRHARAAPREGFQPVLVLALGT